MSYIYQKRAKLVGNVDSGLLWLVNMHDDWIHDQYGESYIYHGIIYSSSSPFHELSTSVTGFFQDDETKRWIKVKSGKAEFNPNDIEQSWNQYLESFFTIKFKTGHYKKYKRTPILN